MNKQLTKLRQHYYSFLSRMFMEEVPPELVKDLTEGEFPIPEEKDWMNKKMKKGFKQLEKFEGKDPSQLVDELAKQYTSLFMGPIEPEFFPYESYYIDGELRDKSLMEVKEFLRKINYGKTDNFPEPEEHIAFEFEIMRKLCERSLNGEDTEEEQKKFLKNHLLTWTPSFLEEFISQNNSKFYKAIGKITYGFLKFEKNQLEK